MSAREGTSHSRAVELATRALAVALAAFVLAEVNYPRLQPQTALALFALAGLVLTFLRLPLARRWAGVRWLRALDGALIIASLAVFAWVVVQTEPAFRSWWVAGSSLGNRAGAEGSVDLWVGAAGLLLVLEATRRAVGWGLPALAALFVLYAALGQSMPGWLFPHRGYDLERIVSQTFLHSQGVFGVALSVMFTYVFLFVLFGALLEVSGATDFVIGATQRLFRRSAGAPAKVAVLSSGLMGSLSGSAVANTATTGTFTIPLMRSAGFRPHVAAAVEAAASSGGALVPPVMGAGAYMMLELVSPPVTYLQIIRAALIPSILYYLSLFLLVHFFARRVGSAPGVSAAAPPPPPPASPRAAERAFPVAGLLFVSSLATLVGLLVAGYTVFRAVAVAMAVVLALSLLSPATRLGPRRLLAAASRAAAGAVPLITAAACVGVVIGVVTLTGVGTRLPSTILPLAESNLPAALGLIMVSSIVLGMGLPSAVCYLLMATLIGPVLGKLGVVPLAAHFFIFYFGMMSMVTPPVALAAYTAASIAGSNITRTGLAAFRFALVGFTLPFMFVFRPQLLLLSPEGGTPQVSAVLLAVAVAVAGILPLAGAIAGYLNRRLTVLERGLLVMAAGLLLFPVGPPVLGMRNFTWIDAGGAMLLGALLTWTWRTRLRPIAVSAEPRGSGNGEP
ncbi:MAG TPA: TRAP transporter fused permease subunit [Thermoanaerobaculia bacterium]|nr:TRAP transporter fused permease subunit [Thermoanaerobaculia bacterium]